METVLHDRPKRALAPARDSEPWRWRRDTRAAGTAEAWRRFADELARRARPRAAVIAYRRAARRDPIDARARHAAAELSREGGDDDAAKALYHDILAINPHDADACARLGALLAEASMAHAVPAEGYLRRAHHLGAEPREALVPLCRLLAAQERDREIVQLTEGYTDAPTVDQRLHAQAALGDLDGAAETACAVLRAHPHHPVAWYNLAVLRRYTRAPADATRGHGGDALACVREKAERSSGELREAYAFALANMLEAEGRFADAWAWYESGNASIHARLGSDVAAVEDAENRTARTFSASTLDRLGRAGIRTSGAVPIFVVGMPRSGTTLVERLLAAHDGIAPLGERADLVEARDHAPVIGGGHDLPWPERAGAVSPLTTGAIAGSYTQRVNALTPPGTRFAVDKHLANSRLIGLIAAALPQARIVHVRRDPRDVMASCFTARFHRGLSWSFDLDAIARRQASHDRLMAHWRRVLPPGRLLEVTYETLVREPERVGREIADFCGFTWNPGAAGGHAATAAPVRTSSVRQVRDAISERSVGRWRRFPGLAARFAETA